MGGPTERVPKPRVLHIDEDVVAIEKPAGILTTPGRGKTLCGMDLLRGMPEVGDAGELRVVHRVDRYASGVLLYARTAVARRELVKEFAAQRVQQTWLAMVTGYVAGAGEVDLRLRYDRRRNRVVASERIGKPARTHYRLVQRLAGNTLLECDTPTGRLHQVRAHLAAIGHPLTIDPEYGGGLEVLLSFYKPGYRPSSRRAERPLIDRLTLHLLRVIFEHPTTGVPITLEANVPKDLRATLTQLARLV